MNKAQDIVQTSATAETLAQINDINRFNTARDRVTKAQDEFLIRLLGTTKEPWNFEVTREAYVRVAKEVQEEFGLIEGDKDLVLFILEQLSRSPRIKKEVVTNE